MNISIRFIALGTAALALSACAVPNYSTPEVATLNAAPKPVAAVKKPARAPAAAPAPVQQQAAAEVQVEEEAVKPTNPWAHQPQGANDPFSDGGDEDGGWG